MAFLNRDILHSFRCSRDCRDFEEAYVSIIGCPFDHNDSLQKKVLPSFVCIPYLLDECKKKMTKDDLLFCEDGFHLSNNDLLDLDLFVKKMADCILSKPFESKPDFKLSGTSLLECCVCFGPFNSVYGQLSDCTHVFCTKCITDWFKKERNCPICRKNSLFILPWHSLIASKEEKAKIVKMQAEMIKASDLTNNLVEPESLTNLARLQIVEPVLRAPVFNEPMPTARSYALIHQEQVHVNNGPRNNFCGNTGRGNNNRGNGRGNNRGNYRSNYRGSNRGGNFRGGHFNSPHHNY